MMEGYKKTALGKIPEDWELFQVDDFLLDRKGAMKIGPFGSQLKKDSFVPVGYKVYGQENIFEKDIGFGDRYITEEHFNRLKTCELHPGDFIISMMGTIGKCMVVPNGIQRGIMDSHLLRLQLNSKKILSSYLSHLFNSPLILSQVGKLAVGGIMAGLSSGIVKKIHFIIPPHSEQKKIAEILSAADEKIEVIGEQISQTQELKRGLMQRLLTKGIGHSRFKDSPLGEIPESWEVAKIGDVTHAFAGGTPKRSKAEYYNGTIPWVKSGEVNSRNILQTEELISEIALKESSAKLIPSNSILVALYGATAGNVGRLRIEASSNQAVLAVNSIDNRLENEFIYHYLKQATASLLSLTQGSGQPNLSKGIIESVFITLPPLDEQQKIADILSTVDEKLEVLQDKKQQYQGLKRGLMQKLLTGKIRVTNLLMKTVPA